MGPRQIITAWIATSLLGGCVNESSRAAAAREAAVEPAARLTDRVAPKQAENPSAPRPESYAGYLFVYFSGEASARGEQIHFALSRGNDPLHWQELNGAAPVLTSRVGTTGVRDPFILRSPDGSRFYLIATDLAMYGSSDWDRVQRQGSQSIVVWESTDLVTWSDERLVRVAPAAAGNTWAPEAFYDKVGANYLVFWASTLYAADDPAHVGSTYNRMLYATTTNFRTFSEPEVWHDPGHAVIDSTVIEAGGTFYRFTKDERSNGPGSPCGKFIQLERSLALANTHWELVAECIGQGTVIRAEGPLVFKSNTAEKWYLFLDEFGGRGYIPFESTDLSSGVWVSPPEYSLPASPRHGTVLPVHAAEHERLLEAFARN